MRVNVIVLLRFFTSTKVPNSAILVRDNIIQYDKHDDLDNKASVQLIVVDKDE